MTALPHTVSLMNCGVYMSLTEYGSWEQYNQRLRVADQKHKSLLGVGCHDCIPRGYTDCEGCDEPHSTWLALHHREGYPSIPISEAGIRIAGL